MAFAIICDRCGQIICPGKNSTYASIRCIQNEIMDDFLFCERCYGELKQWITGNEMEDDE